MGLAEGRLPPHRVNMIQSTPSNERQGEMRGSAAAAHSWRHKRHSHTKLFVRRQLERELEREREREYKWMNNAYALKFATKSLLFAKMI